MSAPTPLTEREETVLAFLNQHRAVRGYYPSTRQVAANFGWKSQTSAVRILRSLVDKGWIIRTGDSRQGIAVINGPGRQNDAALVAELRAWGKMNKTGALTRLLDRAADRIAEMLGPLKA